MRVCYFGTYRAQYMRNRNMIEGLRRNGVTVIECHAPLWQSIEDRVTTVAGGWKRPRFWWRVATVYLRLLSQFWQLRNSFDVLVCGYPGQFDVFLARLLAWWVGKPLAWDLLMSIYLVAEERGLEAQNRTILALIRRAEQLACRLPDLLLQDTEEYVRWYGRTYGVPATRFRLLPIGADQAKYPALPLRPPGARPFRVLYYGTFIPNHDTPAIVEAARLLAPYGEIVFELIGAGPDQQQCAALAARYQLDNIVFVDWLTREDLIDRVAASDLCLGAFGDTMQSRITVHNKIYEGLAMQRPVLTGDSLAVRAALRAGEEVWVCPRHDPHGLASAILRLYFDPALCAQLAVAGHRRFAAEYTLEILGARCKAYLEELLAAAHSA